MAEGERVPSALGSLVLTLFLAVCPVVVLMIAYDDTGYFMMMGASTWALAVAGKLSLAKLECTRALMRRGAIGAGAWGFVSAASELGATAVAVIVLAGPENAAQIAALGFGAALIEIVYVLGTGITEDPRKREAAVAQWIVGARRSRIVRNMLFIERLSASLGHVGSRGLVCLSLAGAGPLPAALGTGLFALIDGLAIYGRQRDWNWCEPSVARRFYAVCLLAGGLELGSFIALSR